MDQILLLDVATELGYELAMCGAETYRVEESIGRIMESYGIEAEVFSIPNCLIVSMETSDGLTRREIGYLPQQTVVQKDFPASVREIVISGFEGQCGLRPFYTREEKRRAE